MFALGQFCFSFTPLFFFFFFLFSFEIQVPGGSIVKSALLFFKKKVRSMEKGRAINPHLYRDEVVRQLASFNDCFRFISVSLFEGQVAGGLVNFKKTW